MAHHSRKLSPKFFSRNPTSTDTTEQKQEQSQKAELLSSTLAIAILFSSAGIILMFAWVSILLILHPGKLNWLNKYLPEWAQIPFGYSEHPYTIEKIQASLREQKQTAGATLALNEGENSFLLPVFQQRANCQADCQELVALRVYQLIQDSEFESQPEKYYRLATQLSVTGLEKSFVETTAENDDTNIPLTTVKRFEGETPASGVWFNLQGQHQQGTKAIAYGQILYYNPERTNLLQLLSWQNPNGQLPKWEQVTGDGAKELVIDHTTGLEPQLRIYQVVSTKLYLNPIRLERISLKTPAIKDTAYKNALSMARSGLWTPALTALEALEKQNKKPFSATAQAQVDLIRLHAQITQAQAEKDWASPSERVLADLIDGRWEKALKVFERSSQSVQEISTLLKTDKSGLWNRVVAALEVNPQQPEVIAWGALILAVQQGNESADAWLQKQPKITKADLADIQDLLKRVHQELAKS